MSTSIFRACAFSLLFSPLISYADFAQDSYVTRSGTPADFDLSGSRIACTTATETVDGTTGERLQGCQQQIYGRRLYVTGTVDKQTKIVTAKHIELLDLETGRPVSGFALIDAVLPGGVVRADGHAIVIDAKTKMTRDKAMPQDAEPKVHTWLKYSGVRRADGAVVASEVALAPMDVTKREENLRKKSEFDAASVSEKDKQGTASKIFRGVDYKRIPASKNAAMQERVAAIGRRLVPEYQKRLEDGDPRKLNFRFQVVTGIKYSTVPFSSGIILVDERAVGMLRSDDEIAAILAMGLAVALERDGYRYLPAQYALAATTMAAAVGDAFLLGTGAGTWVANHTASKLMNDKLTEQALRLSLVLMHDAGYSVDAAPVALWHVRLEKDDFMSKSVPHEAAYLYQALATDWGPGSLLRGKH